MTTIRIHRQLNLSEEETRALAERVEQKLTQEYGLSFNWSGNCASIKGSGVSGTCTLEQGSISIALTLGFLLMAFKPAIEEKINDYLDRVEK